MDICKDIILPFAWALLGGVLTFIGTLITFRHESKIRRKENIEKAKPIIINYMFHQAPNEKLPKYIFEAEEKDDGSNVIIGILKNTDNGLLFFDYIKTENKIYYPKHSSTVDKNTVFYILLSNIEHESLKECNIYCHDIFNNNYYYRAHFALESETQSQIVIDNIMPLSCKNEKANKREQ